MLRKITPLLVHVARATQCNLPYNTRNFLTAVAVRASVYEPDYLDSLKPKYPQYDSLNIQIKGYDYPILESYQRYVHSLAEYLDIEVGDCFIQKEILTETWDRSLVYRTLPSCNYDLKYGNLLSSYGLPPQNTTVQRFKPNSAVIDSEYRLKTYERNLQLLDVSAPIYPMFLRIAQAALPEGVELSVQEHTDDCEEKRYVPDKDLQELKAELEKIQIAKKK